MRERETARGGLSNQQTLVRKKKKTKQKKRREKKKKSSKSRFTFSAKLRSLSSESFARDGNGEQNGLGGTG